MGEKKKAVLQSVVAFIVMFLVIGQFTSWYNFFWFTHIFNAFTVLVFASILYVGRTRIWEKKDYKKFGILLIVFGLPHIILSMVSYGSMICLGVSVILLICFFIKVRKLPSENVI